MDQLRVQKYHCSILEQLDSVSIREWMKKRVKYEQQVAFHNENVADAAEMIIVNPAQQHVSTAILTYYRMMNDLEHDAAINEDHLVEWFRTLQSADAKIADSTVIINLLRQTCKDTRNTALLD